MGSTLKHFLAACLIALALPPAQAQDIAGPIAIVVTGPAGGTPDIVARITAEKISAALGVPVVVENRAGGQAALGTVQAVAAAEPDGRTLLQANTSLFSIGPAAYTNPVYDPEADFAPISVMATSPNILFAHADVPARTVEELVEALRSNPGRYIFGSGGVGTPMHLYGEVIKSQYSLQFTHVPYRGSAPAITDMLAGEVHFMLDQIPSSLPHIQAGTFNAIAVANSERIASLPDVPTFAEAGLEGAQAISWFGLVAPAGTPEPIVTRISEAVQEAMRDLDVVARFEVLGATAVGSTPDEMTAHVQRQLEAWTPLVEAAGFTLD